MAHEDRRGVYDVIRALGAKSRHPIGILQGPKIRIGAVEGGRFAVAVGDRIRFLLRGTDGTPQSIPLSYQKIFAAITPDQDLLIDDGKLRVRVRGMTSDFINAEVIVGGAVFNRKGVNLLGTVLDLSPMTAKDRVDLDFILSLGVNWVALSFVQRPADLIEARGLIGDRGGLLAKIEKPSALDHIDDIARQAGAANDPYDGDAGPTNHRRIAQPKRPPIEPARFKLALIYFTNRPGVTSIETSIIFDARRRNKLSLLRQLD